MREALTEALQDYTGALIVVAHDRHLLRATADELWLAADGKLSPFDGDLDDYRQWVLEERSAQVARAQKPRNVAAIDRKAQRREEAAERQRLASLRKPYEHELAQLEKELAELASEKQALDDWLASPDAYVDEVRQRLKETLTRQGDVTWRLARAEAAWLQLQTTLEQLDGH